MGALDRVADLIVHGARESFLRTLTTRLVGALRALVSGTGSEARAANALDMASARVSELAMGTWAEFRPRVTAQAAREVGAALRDSDETLSRELAAATGADRPWGLSNRARNDLAEATRGVREVVGRRNVRYEPTEAAAIARRAAAAQAMQGATDAHTAAQAWYEVAGAAITRVDMGDDPADVMRDAVAELARRGLETVDYRSGARTSVDAAVRRHIDSQLNQAANDMAMRQCEEWGVGLVMVDAHWGARPSHARWQGKAYSLHGEVEVDGITYPDLYEATGYQGRNGWPLGARLAGVNCRHRMYPYVPGVSQIPSDDFEAMARKYGMTSEEYYAATQRQRALERALRAAKREAAFLEDEGLDATGLERDPTREKAYGVTHQPRGLTSSEGFTRRADDLIRTAAPGTSVKVYTASSIRTRNGFKKCRWAYQREYGAVYDSRGRIISDVFVGDEGSVSFAVPDGFDWTDRRVVHTHPGKRGGTFSGADANLLSYEAVAREGVYAIERTPAATESSRRRLTADYSAFEDKVADDRYHETEDEFLAKGRDPYLADHDEFVATVLSKMHADQHEWLTKHVVEYGYRYSFEPSRKR